MHVISFKYYQQHLVVQTNSIWSRKRFFPHQKSILQYCWPTKCKRSSRNVWRFCVTFGLFLPFECEEKKYKQIMPIHMPYYACGKCLVPWKLVNLCCYTALWCKPQASKWREKNPGRGGTHLYGDVWPSRPPFHTSPTVHKTPSWGTSPFTFVENMAIFSSRAHIWLRILSKNLNIGKISVLKPQFLNENPLTRPHFHGSLSAHKPQSLEIQAITYLPEKNWVPPWKKSCPSGLAYKTHQTQYVYLQMPSWMQYSVRKIAGQR